MGKIHRLSDDLANQIAAGEVVERPASVVKELIENALDAGATKVRVELDQGGFARLAVTDDGEGMDPDDAALALERHATSKIQRFEDLTRIGTFGFRGEALPSIASVARLSLVTRTRDRKEGVELRVEGGGSAAVRPCGCAIGTRVDVSELFFNVPARRKFLKSQGTEAAHVGEVVLLAALARPDVTFVLVRDGRTAREYLRAATRPERVAQAFDEPLQACEAVRGPVRIEAFLGAPERARAGAVALHLFVNGRPVKDRALARAVAHAYGSVLEPGRYPVGALYIDLPPEHVDVNVHPQKAEVRFADARALYDAVTRELHIALARAFNLPALGGPRHSWGRQQDLKVRPEAPAGETRWSAGEPPAGRPILVAEAREPPVTMRSILAAEPVAEFGPGSEARDERPSPGAPAAPLFDPGGFYGRLVFLAQARATYLLCEGSDGLYVLDQHAAAERVTFHRLRRDFESRAVASQRLLVPEVVPLQPAELAILEETLDGAQGAAIDEVSRLGVELRLVGKGAVAVHAVPKILARRSAERIVRDLLAEVGRVAKRPFRDAADLVLATMACHGSVRAGDAVSREEAEALLRALDEVDFAGHCPHGRPVVMRLPFEELERRVGR